MMQNVSTAAQSGERPMAPHYAVCFVCGPERFVRRTPVASDLTAAAWLAEQSGRKILAEGEIRSGGAVTATARATFVTIDRQGMRSARRAAVSARVTPPNSAATTVEGAIKPHSDACWACGTVPGGLALVHSPVGDEVVSLLATRAEFDGLEGFVHGGVIAAFFDDALGAAPLLLGDTYGVTGQLNVRYHNFARNDGRTYVGRSRLQAHEGRKLTVTGTMQHGDDVVASADAMFIEVPKSLRRN
jgi:acyl-coenzyme A thioesterase PaaI-like protein